MSAIAQTSTDQRITRLCLQRVLHDFGELLEVIPIDDTSFRVSTPFSFDNGDHLPIVVETRGTAWRITDRGDTIAYLTRGHIELTEFHKDLIQAIVRTSGFTLSASNHIRAEFDELPSPVDIAKIIEIEVGIGLLSRFLQDASHQP
jgi:hypothetical protein